MKLAMPPPPARMYAQGPELSQAVEATLKSVNLWAGGVAAKPVGKFSGGMKRRLSVGISLIGHPAVVYMDEPSTVSPADAASLFPDIATVLLRLC